jgi:hypothetical protein
MGKVDTATSIVQQMRCPLVMLAAAAALLASTTAPGGADPYVGDHVGDALVWDHDSSLVVRESIASIGGGNYRYSFELTNTESAPIGELAVYVWFPGLNPSPFSKQGWVAVCDPLSQVYPEFDARNVDPSLAYLVGNYGPGAPGNSSNPIAIGEAASGFSFTAPVYDARPLLYQYNVLGNYPPSTGHSTAAGYTVVPEVPSPSALLCALAGFAGMTWRRKR